MDPINTALISSLSTTFAVGNGSTFDISSGASNTSWGDFDLSSSVQDIQEMLRGTEDGNALGLPSQDNLWATSAGENFASMDFLNVPGNGHSPHSHTTQNLSLCSSTLAPDSTSTDAAASRCLSEESGHELPQLDADILHGIELYLELAVDPPPALHEDPSRLRTLLLQATDLCTGRRSLFLVMSAAGYRMAQRDSSLAQILYEEGCVRFEQRLAVVANGAPVTIDECVDIMYALQAASILVPYAYGMRDTTKGKNVLLGAARMAASIGLHLLDSRTSPPEPARLPRMIEEVEREGNGCARIADSACHEFRSCVPCLTEALRQAWWELYVCNAVFLASTARAGPKEGSVLGFDASIKPPTGFALSHDTSVSAKLWQLRIRSAALLIESVSEEHALDAVANARLHALDTMSSNLLSSLHGLDLRVCTTSSKGSSSRAHHLRLTIELIVRGAQIHLHRLRWVPRFNLELRSCSFNVADNLSAERDEALAGSTIGRSLVRLADDAQYDAACRSLSIIRAHSNAIIDLIMTADKERMLHQTRRSVDADATSMPLDPLAPALYRWPFFCCIQVVAAFGQLIAMTAHRLSDRCGLSSETADTKSTFLCMSSHSMTEEFVAFNQSSGVVTAPASKWLRLEACSNLEFSENLLGCVEGIWPFAQHCKAEIEACRSCIDGIGGITGLQYSI